MFSNLYKILVSKFWTEETVPNQKGLYQLLIIWLFIGMVALAMTAFHWLFTSVEQSLAFCDMLLFAICVLSIVCILNARKSCVINMVFTIPIFIYGYYISELSMHTPLVETVHFATWLLIVGLVYLYFFARRESVILLYATVSLITIGVHLHFANHLVDSLSFFKPITNNPFFIFSVFFLLTFYLRKRYVLEVEELERIASKNKDALDKAIQNSSFLVSRLVAERDEDKNIVNLLFDKVNNAFESTFNINLYEVKGQEVNYIFNLIFKEPIDVNQILLFDKKKSSEFYIEKQNKWYRAFSLNPSYNVYYLVLEDITEVKEKIAKLEVNKQRYKVLLEAIPDIFFVIGKDGIYEDFVIKESDLFKMEDADIIGSSIFNAGFPDKMANKIYGCIQHCLKTNSIETIEYSLDTPNGTFLFEMRLAKLNSNSVISVARDITKRKTAEFKLSKALVRAEESDRLKSAFLTNLSHEIRTPMNIITNFTRMLADESLESEQRVEFVDAVMQNGQQLLNMIDNTIHLSRIETESIQPKTEFCQINSILRNIYNGYAPNVPDSKNLKVELVIGVSNPKFGFTIDGELLKETLSILVDNAIKYTEAGLVTFGYKMMPNDQIKFFVKDTGIGIPQDEQEHIFSRFYRVKNKINQSTSGSGIGLSIAEHYVRLLGSKLKLQSEVNKGTEFSFILPTQDVKGYMRVVS